MGRPFARDQSSPSSSSEGRGFLHVPHLGRMIREASALLGGKLGNGETGKRRSGGYWGRWRWGKLCNSCAIKAMPIKNKRIAACKRKNAGAESRAGGIFNCPRNPENRYGHHRLVECTSIWRRGLYISHLSIFALFSSLSLLIRSFLIGLHPSVVFSTVSSPCVMHQSAICKLHFLFWTLDLNLSYLPTSDVSQLSVLRSADFQMKRKQGISRISWIDFEKKKQSLPLIT